MVLGVHLEVLGEIGDALRQERDLHLGRPGVARRPGEFLYDLCLFNCGQTHVTLDFSLFFCASMSYETPVESTPEAGFFRASATFATVEARTLKARNVLTAPPSPGSTTATRSPSSWTARIDPAGGAPARTSQASACPLRNAFASASLTRTAGRCASASDSDTN